MEVIIPQLSGFCPGVKQAVSAILNEHDKNPEKRLYVYGNLINNRSFIHHLENLNIITTEDLNLIPRGSTVAIRTHGIDCKVEAQLKKNFQVIDLTCPTVKRVQLKIKEYSANHYFIIIIGHKNHPETIGHLSYAKDSFVIEQENDLDEFTRDFKTLLHKDEEYKKVFIISQTTGDIDLYQKTIVAVSELKNLFMDTFDSICRITQQKGKQAAAILKDVDITFVLGDTLSANAVKLFQFLSSRGKNVYFVNDLDSLKSLELNFSGCKKALVVSSASTPFFIEQSVSDYLTGIT